MDKYKLIIVSLFIFGFFYRLWFATLAIQTVKWDAEMYSGIANVIVDGKVQANCCNIGLGYPLFVALIYRIFGHDSFWQMRIIQIIIELFTALLIYKTAKNLFGRDSAIWAYGLYIINPFTSSFTGLILTSVLAFFLIILTANLLTLPDFTKRPARWLFFGALTGLTAFVKVSFYHLAIFTGLIFAFILFDKTKISLKFLAFYFLGFLIASSISIYTNYKTFGKISIAPPYRVLGGPLYTSFYRGRSGELDNEIIPVHPEFDKYIRQYYINYHFNTTALPEYNRTYMDKFLKKFAADWPQFISNTFRNIVWIWDKYHLFEYKDPFYPKDKTVVRILNIIYLGFSAFGFLIYAKSKKILKNPILLFSILLVGFISFAYGIINNETRLSLPFYPIAAVWAGYGIYNIKNKISNIKNKRTM